MGGGEGHSMYRGVQVFLHMPEFWCNTDLEWVGGGGGGQFVALRYFVYILSNMLKLLLCFFFSL